MSSEPTTLYCAATGGSRYRNWNTSEIAMSGLTSVDGFQVLYGNARDAGKALEDIVGAGGDVVNIFAVDVSGLAVSKTPPFEMFVDVRGDAWFCIGDITPERFSLQSE